MKRGAGYHRAMRLRSGLGLLVALGVGAACSSGGDTETAPSSTPPPTTVAATTTTTAEPTTTTAAPTTTVAPTTTAAPTTTVDPTGALIAEIEADLNEGEQALLAAAAAPGSPEARANLERYFSGQSLEGLIRVFDQLVQDGLVGRASATVESVLRVRDIVEVNPSQSEATIVVCRVDAAVVYEPLSDGSEAIVSDAITTVVSESLVTKFDGIWRLDSGVRLEDLPGASTCD